MESKKKYFFKSYEKSPTKTADSTTGEINEDPSSNMKKIKNLYFELEQMRANSEKDRIKSYRELLEGLLT